MTELTDEKKAEFAALMKNYNGNGGPFIMIDLNDLYDEERRDPYESGASAADLIKEAVSSEVHRAFAPRIKQACEGEATRFIYEQLNEEIKFRFNKLFEVGYTKTIIDPETKEKREEVQISIQEHMQNVLDNFFSYQPSKNITTAQTGNHRRNEKPASLKGLHGYCEALVTKFLEERTKEIIEDVNKEVLVKAKASISQTVSDQLFEGLNLLPKLGGVQQN